MPVFENYILIPTYWQCRCVHAGVMCVQCFKCANFSSVHISRDFCVGQVAVMKTHGRSIAKQQPTAALLLVEPKAHIIQMMPQQ